MARRLSGGRLVVASHNAGKVREVMELLRPFAIEAVPAGDLDLPEPEESGTTYEANAELKALAAARAANLPALADDSGISVAALGGEPGVYSARWAGPDRDFMVAMQRVNEALGDEPDRRARFVSVLCLAWPDGHCETVRGTVDGHLVWPPRGSNGFGYDPMFVPDGFDQTFGEMEPALKDELSHRAVAFRRLRAACLDPAGRA